MDYTDLILLLLFIIFVASAAVLFALYVLDRLEIIEVERWLAPIVPSLMAISIFFGDNWAAVTAVLNTRIRILISLASLMSLVLAIIGVILIRKLKIPLKKELHDIEKALKRKIESMRHVHQARALHMELRSYETEIDALYQHILKKGKVTLEEVISRFNISKELAEEWAKILESHKLITISYSPFGALILTTPQGNENEEAK